MNVNHSTNIASNTTLPVLTVKDGHPVTTSLDVAKVFGKQHKDVLRSIREVELPDDFIERNFALSGYPVAVLRACIADHAQQRCGIFKQG